MSYSTSWEDNQKGLLKSHFTKLLNVFISAKPLH